MSQRVTDVYVVTASEIEACDPLQHQEWGLQILLPAQPLRSSITLWRIPWRTPWGTCSVRTIQASNSEDLQLARATLAIEDPGLTRHWLSTLYEYLLREWLIKGTQEKRCRAWTNQILHFDELVTSTAGLHCATQIRDTEPH